MAIQNRRGPYEKLDKRKLLPAEWAIVLENDPLCKDGKSVYICFSAGDTKRMATYEDMAENIDNHTEEIIESITSEANAATQRAINAATGAENITEDLIAKRDAGEFTGPQGANGVVTVIQGQVAFQVVNGDLIMYYDDNDTAPDYSIDANGDLILNIGGDL